LIATSRGYSACMHGFLVLLLRSETEMMLTRKSANPELAVDLSAKSSHLSSSEYGRLRRKQVTDGEGRTKRSQRPIIR